MKVGDVLKRKPSGDEAWPAKARISAVDGSRWVLESLDEFSSPISIEPHLLAENYVGADGVPPEHLDEQELWQRFGEQPRIPSIVGKDRLTAESPPGRKPEEIFAEAAAASDDA